MTSAGSSYFKYLKDVEACLLLMISELVALEL